MVGGKEPDWLERSGFPLKTPRTKEVGDDVSDVVRFDDLNELMINVWWFHHENLAECVFQCFCFTMFRIYLKMMMFGKIKMNDDECMVGMDVQVMYLMFFFVSNSCLMLSLFSSHVEAYMFRQFFASHFGDNSAAAGTVGGLSSAVKSEVSALNPSQIGYGSKFLKSTTDDHPFWCCPCSPFWSIF